MKQLQLEDFCLYSLKPNSLLNLLLGLRLLRTSVLVYQDMSGNVMSQGAGFMQFTTSIKQVPMAKGVIKQKCQ